jgi:hypothetical protein
VQSGAADVEAGFSVLMMYFEESLHAGGEHGTLWENSLGLAIRIVVEKIFWEELEEDGFLPPPRYFQILPPNPNLPLYEIYLD